MRLMTATPHLRRERGIMVSRHLEVASPDARFQCRSAIVVRSVTQRDPPERSRP